MKVDLQFRTDEGGPCGNVVEQFGKNRARNSEFFAKLALFSSEPPKNLHKRYEHRSKMSTFKLKNSKKSDKTSNNVVL